MYPDSESNYDSGLAALRKLASLDVQQDDNASDMGYVPYVFTEYTHNKQIFLKVLYVDIPETTRKGLVQPFRLVCKIKDPIIYSETSHTASTQGVDPTTSGGTAIFPFTFPIIFGASTFTVSNNANNTGDIPVYPLSIVVVGPVNNPIITNETTGEYIKVTGNLATTSNILTITYDKDTLGINLDGNSVLGNVVTGSTYFKLQPGVNSISLGGSSIGSGAYVAVNYFSGWSLS